MDDSLENPYLLLTPGPLSTSPTVRQAMLRDWCTWDDDYNLGVVAPIREKLVNLARSEERRVGKDADSVDLGGRRIIKKERRAAARHRQVLRPAPPERGVEQYHRRHARHAWYASIESRLTGSE